MEPEEQLALQQQMIRSFETDAKLRNRQDHGRVAGNLDEDAVQDAVLERAVTIIREGMVWSDLVEKYHRDISETQQMASAEEREKAAH